MYFFIFKKKQNFYVICNLKGYYKKKNEFVNFHVNEMNYIIIMG